MMDEQGIDRAMMWPTLASLLEERLADDPVATHVVVHALNQWMHEQWTFNFENRIFPTPVITLPIVDKAIEELEWVVERGAKAILIRPAPVPDFNGRRRSFALPEFDPFWKKVVEADIVVGMHASDSGFQRYVNEWEGHDGEFLPFNTKLSALLPRSLHADNRVISDIVTSIIGHGLATRFPDAAHHAGRERQRLGAPARRASSRRSTRGRRRRSTRTRWRRSSATSTSTRSTRRTRSAS